MIYLLLIAIIVSNQFLDVSAATFLSENSHYSARQNAAVSGEGNINIFRNCTFENCYDPQYTSGGALFMALWQQQSCQIINCSFNNCRAKEGGAIFVYFGGAQSKLTIDSCIFIRCKSLDGGGGAIMANSSDANTYGLIIEGSIKTTFSSCEASTFGGAIFLGLESGTEDKFNLGGADYSQNTNTLNIASEGGNNLFINSHGQLKNAVPIGQGSKVGAKVYTYEIANLNNLMGNDIGQEPAPLYYVYSAREQGVYHSFYTSAEQGINNAGCGHLQYPCQSISYAISLNPSSANPIKAGIISGHWMQEQISIGEAGKITQIQRQTNLTDDYSHIQNYGTNSFACSYEVIFQDLHFDDRGGIGGQVIDLVDATSKVSILNCKLILLGYSQFKHKFVNAEYGNLTITNLIVNSIQTTNSSLFNIGSSAVIVSITSSTFGSYSADISYTLDSKLIQATISGSLIVNTGTTFLRCLSASNGGVMNLEIVNNGKVELSQVTMQDCKGTYGGFIYTEISGSGKLTIKDGCSFSGCQATAGNGGAIYAQIKSGTSGGLSITGTTKTTFANCQALPTDSGLGGAIYLDLASGTETKFDLTGASYSITTNSLNNALYGKNLFIKAQGDLQVAVPLNQGSKIGAGLDSYEKANLQNLMGYDLGITTNAIPLYFVYSIPLDIYHLANLDSTPNNGNDNKFCGNLLHPCLTVNYAISRSGTATAKKLGIITGYKISQEQTLAQSGKDMKIFNQLTNADVQQTDNSVLLIESTGKFTITAQSLSIDRITFSVSSNATSDYVITGKSTLTQIVLTNCKMIMTSGSSSVKTGLVQTNSGTLSINKITVSTIKIAGQSIIKIANGAGNVDIIDSAFSSIERTDANGNGAVIIAELSGSSKLTISNQCSFTSCTSAGYGGAIYSIISGGSIDLNRVTMNVCKATNGGGIYTKLSGTGKLTITNQTVFTGCQGTTGVGGAIYCQVISGASSNVCLSITGTNKTTFTSCTVPTSTSLGGAIYLDLQSGTETKFDLTGASYLTENDAKYGKSLFINAINLRTVVPIDDAARIKLGAINPETDMYNLMGYDNGVTSIAIPLYYMYTAVGESVYHVNIASGTNAGNNNIGCGHSLWPCLTFEYSLTQSTIQHPSATQRIIGVISEYQYSEQLTFSSVSILVQNSLNPSNNQTTTILSNMKITSSGRFVVSGQIVEFKYLNFLIQSGGSSSDYIIQSTLGTSSISILNSEFHQDTETISRGLIQLTLGSVSIIDFKFESFAKSGGSLIKQDGGTLSFTGGQMTSVVIDTGNMIQINSGTTTLNSFSASDITLNGGSLISYSSTENLNIDRCIFTNIQNTIANGNGGVISGTLSSTSGSISITGSTSTFTSCTVPSDSGLGGAIYLDIQTDGETKYDLTGASYLTGNNALYGKSLFINAYDLSAAVPIGDPTRIKLGAINPETDMYNLMGYDSVIGTLTIPLYYVYTTVNPLVFHVNNPISPFEIGSGNDNIFCGHLGWPCLTIDYSLSQCEIQHPSATQRIIGIINGYILNEQIEFDQDDEVQIQNSLTESGTVTDIQSILNVEDNGKFLLTTGTLSFNTITLIINENASTGYIISGSATSAQISISNCIMKMFDSLPDYLILTGLVELIGGSLNINNLEISDISISDSPIIFISENAGSVNIINSQIDNILRTTSDDSTSKVGGTIEATIGGSSGQLSISNTDFIKCISQQSYQAGGISLIIKNQRTVSISQTSFIQCESDQGSGINAQIQYGGVLTIDGTCSFVCCKARLDLGAALYSTISGINSKLIVKDEIQFEGFMKDQEGNKQTQFGQGRGIYIDISNDGIVEINEILFNECKGINGGGIQIISQSTQKQTFNGTQFTRCVADENGGGIYCIINQGEIEMNQISMSGCSGLNGGGIYSSIDGTGKLTIQDSSSFTNCNSSNGNGGGIYISIDFSTQSQISVQSTTFDSCQALNPYISNIHKGYGSGIFISCINWNNISNGINFGQVEYINCEAYQGDKGLFFVMDELRQFCRLGNPRGQYVRSKDYTTELSDISLLMGYRGSPNQFNSASSEDLKDKISELEYYIRDSSNQWHISTMNKGIDRLSCGLKPNPCRTINYAFLLNPILFEGQYVPNTNIATMILLEDDMIDTMININTDTIIGNNIAIQSENGGEGKTLSIDKIYKIGSNAESNTLFNVNGDGIKLGLYHLKLDNSFATSTSPLILLTGDTTNINDAQLTIESCIFAQSGNAPLPELKHNLIQIIGGQASI
ncbi:MAG: hypothetical protein EZS28_005011, partial [Streblomastix strix]